MSYTVEYTDIAIKDIEQHKKAGDKAVLKKLFKLLLELEKHPKTGKGQPEELKHNLAGLYSRRINRKHRIIYKIDEGRVIVLVLSVSSHYDV